MAKVVLQNISKWFDSTAVVRDMDLLIQDKEFLVLVGPSGCGKTTTLRMIAGMEEISRGEIYIGDRRVNEVAPKDRDIAMVFQNYALYPHMNVYDNMAFGLRIRGISKREIDGRVNEAAEILGLKDLLKRLPKQLSGGQRQRVAVGRAIVRKPKVFLMDEPLSNLDAKLRVQMRAELKKIHARLQTTIVYVTHDQVEAMTLGDRIAVMVQGQVQQVDRPTTIYEKPANRFVAGFIGSPPMNFVRGELRRRNGQILFDAESILLPLPNDLVGNVGNYVGKKVVLGIRPEDIVDEGRGAMLSERESIRCRVEFRELMGSETYLYLKVGTIPLIARVDAMNDARSGMELTMVVNLHKIHLFDEETQKAVV